MSRYPKSTHFIDTCVLLETLLSKKKDTVRDCTRYLWRVGHVFAGVVSIPVLGEFSKIALEDSSDAGYLFGFLTEFVQRRKVSITSVSPTGLRAAEVIRKADDRVELLDALHLACAKESGCSRFVTIDGVLLGNRRVEKVAGVSIEHPRAFL